MTQFCNLGARACFFTVRRHAFFGCAMRIPTFSDGAEHNMRLFPDAMQSPLFIVFDESDSDVGWWDNHLIRLQCSSFVRIASGSRYLCALRTEWINERRGNEGEKFGYRRTTGLDLDLGQSGLDLLTTEFIPAGAINPEIGVFLWPNPMRQTRRRVLYGYL